MFKHFKVYLFCLVFVCWTLLLLLFLQQKNEIPSIFYMPATLTGRFDTYRHRYSYEVFNQLRAFKTSLVSKAINYDAQSYRVVVDSFAPASEAFDPHSSFYGVVFKDFYGKSWGKVNRTSFQDIAEDWQSIFPNLWSSLSKQELSNPAQNNIMYTIQASVFVEKHEFFLGEEFTATITSIDGLGKPKTFGGDYYRARLIRDDGKYPDGIPCRVIDNLDGSYTVKAPLLLEGLLMLDVELIMSVEGIRELNEEVTKFTCDLNGYVAQLDSNEDVHCGFVANCFTEEFLCDYSSPFNKGVWVCQVPPSGTCSNIKNSIYKKELDSLKPIVDLGIKYKCNRKMKRTTISVENKPTTTIKLPQCRELFQHNIISESFEPVSGYFSKKIWRSTVCDSHVLDNSIVNLNVCLQNKVIFMFGDSTIRQYFTFTMDKLKLTRHGRDNTHIWAEPSAAYHDDVHVQNTTLYYRAHGPPLKNPGPPFIRVYIADSVVGLPIGGEDVYVVINIGAHLYSLDPSAYMHRLKTIRYAIETHHKSYPKTKFIIRGQNVVFKPNLELEWSIYALEMILRSVFTDMSNVVYLNLWDPTTVWPLEDVHPPTKVLEQEALMMFSYLC